MKLRLDAERRLILPSFAKQLRKWVPQQKMLAESLTNVRILQVQAQPSAPFALWSALAAVGLQTSYRMLSISFANPGKRARGILIASRLQADTHQPSLRVALLLALSFPRAAAARHLHVKDAMPMSRQKLFVKEDWHRGCTTCDKRALLLESCFGAHGVHPMPQCKRVDDFHRSAPWC
eukprot:6484869-Amphidinium_carterae.1